MAGLLDGGTSSRVYCVGRGVYMGLYYANLSFVEFRTMILGITCIYVCIYIYKSWFSLSCTLELLRILRGIFQIDRILSAVR